MTQIRGIKADLLFVPKNDRSIIKFIISDVSPATFILGYPPTPFHPSSNHSNISLSQIKNCPLVKPAGMANLESTYTMQPYEDG
ncbi:MAG: hypothetical protein ABI402_10580 [Ferruginibacter sp.]